MKKTAIFFSIITILSLFLISCTPQEQAQLEQELAKQNNAPAISTLPEQTNTNTPPAEPQKEAPKPQPPAQQPSPLTANVVLDTNDFVTENGDCSKFADKLIAEKLIDPKGAYIVTAESKLFADQRVPVAGEKQICKIYKPTANDLFVFLRSRYYDEKKLEFAIVFIDKGQRENFNVTVNLKDFNISDLAVEDQNLPGIYNPPPEPCACVCEAGCCPITFCLA